MSAYLVHKAHVAAIIRWYVRNGGVEYESDRGLYDWPLIKAEMLYVQNERSVNARYPQETTGDPVTYTYAEIDAAPGLSAVACIKACQCLEYQSCDTDDWDRTESKRLIDRIISHAIGLLPGYSDAAWDITPDRVS